MKFLKKSQLNFRNVKDQSVSVETDGRVTMDGKISLLIPKGRTVDRPTSPVEGMIRYNSDTTELEAYQGNSSTGSAIWRKVKFKEPSAISFQSFISHSGGDMFGPLTPFNTIKENTNADLTATEVAERLLVIVENTIQVANVNYEILFNPLGYAAGVWVHFGSNVPTTKNIYVISGFDR
jgi:hypothetical protein